jgi:hypothetical protein
MNRNQQRAIWHKLKKKREPVNAAQVHTNKIHIKICGEIVRCSICGRFSHHGRRPLGWYPKDESRSRLNRLVRQGVSISVLNDYMGRCDPICRGCKRKRSK